MHKLYHFIANRPIEDLVLDSNYKLPGRCAQYLKSFQLDGIRFLFKHFKNNNACILNDESGLGKTALVASFLEAVVPHDQSRNCLIIVNNHSRQQSWKFHLDTLTKLPTKIVKTEEDLGREIVFIIAYRHLRKSPQLLKKCFDCIILDDRGGCTSSALNIKYFLENFENKISLIIASADLTLNLPHFHSMLRLCGCLDSKYKNLKVFTEKFHLPKPTGRTNVKDMLELYFQSREKIINYCRDFRLRRYCHQFEDEIPLTSVETFKNSLKEWQENPVVNSSPSSSGSVEIKSLSSEKSTDELFQLMADQDSLMPPNQQANKNIAIIAARITTGETENSDIVDMPPLVLESDTDEEENNNKLHQSEKKLIIIPNSSIVDNVQQQTPRKCKSRTFDNNTKCEKRVTRHDHIITRSMSQKQKYIMSNINIDVIKHPRKRKTRGKAKAVSSPTPKLSTSKVPLKISLITHNSSLPQRCVPSDTVCDVSPIDQSIDVISDTPRNQQQLLEAGKQLFSIRDVNILISSPELNSVTSESDFVADLNKTLLADTSTEVQQLTPDKVVINLISSTDDSSPAKSDDNRVRLSSPDLFSGTQESDLRCGQYNKTLSSNPFKIFGSEIIKKASRLPRSKSCLELLAKDFRRPNRVNSVGENSDDLLLAVSTNYEARSNGNKKMDETSSFQIRYESNRYRNKITKYFPYSQLLDSSSSDTLEELEVGKAGPANFDNTPKQDKMKKMQPTTSRRSMKLKTNGHDKTDSLTPNSLTKWLIKPTTCNDDGLSKTSKRRRLDLWFKD